MPGPVLSSAESRRPLVAAAAIDAFARGGFHATTVADVARGAKISSAYVFKLFSGKNAVFVAALERCFDEILAALERGADEAEEQSADAVLDAMGAAYAQLIADRRLLLLQVHAQSVADVPEIGAALRAGLARVTSFAKTRSGATNDEVQRFMAFGQLCHLIVTAQIWDLPDDWAKTLTHGVRHPG
jgi:AcrR family transcriptional regulator